MENTSFKIKKVQKRSAEVQAADVLREAIVSGEIPLGTRLTEIHSSEQLGVSRSTIRTAFHQLVQEGLIVQIPYTGWSVMTLGPEDAWELYTLRASLEALAAKIVAKKVGEDTASGHVTSAITDAFGLLKAACQQGSKGEIATADMNLHSTIVQLSGHSRLIDQYSRIQSQILICIRSSDALVASPAHIVEQHLPLINALNNGNAEEAAKEAILHNETEGAILVSHLQQRDK
ncbi:GntR family transcriptional regulator [Pantoea sp. A4]|uniref:GntR family transcriptional regulator n=1 Tax=Pantoea sp. A4 TaxID=1225184 RepID=UPI00037ECDBE|nr:GntR family transcriptional regulator [Pantoea sp. A4]